MYWTRSLLVKLNHRGRTAGAIFAAACTATPIMVTRNALHFHFFALLMTVQNKRNAKKKKNILFICDVRHVHLVLLRFLFLFTFFMTRLQKHDIISSLCLLTSSYDNKISRDAVTSQSQMMSCHMTSGCCTTSWCHMMPHAVMIPRDMTSAWDLWPCIEAHRGHISMWC